MNNTKTTTLAIAAIFIAVTLVVGGTFAAISAFAYMIKGQQDNERNTR
jgi:TRAP-type C4-dicarboxylate transport system permease small subunit